MRTELIKAVDARMVSVELSDVGVYVMPIWRFYNMHPTGQLSPERAEFRWENGELVRMAVYGRRLRKDGTPGYADATTQFVLGGIVLGENPIPDWLADLRDEQSPERGR